MNNGLNRLRQNLIYFLFRSALVFTVLLLPNLVTNGQNLKKIDQNSTKVCQKGDYNFSSKNLETQLFDDFMTSCVPKEKGIPEELILKWTIKSPGNLEFIIRSENPRADIDFELYLNTGNGLKMVRCVAAGPTIGQDPKLNDKCLGSTGLRDENVNVSEGIGCIDDYTSFAAPIFVNKGETYILRIFNFSSSSDFQFSLDGSAELTHEYIAHDIDAKTKDHPLEWNFEIDKSPQDGLSDICWDFGNDAFPKTISNSSSVKTRFNSTGDKLVKVTFTRNYCHFQKARSVEISDSDLNNNFENTITAAPNPFDKFTNIEIFSTENYDNALLIVTAINGSKVYSQRIDLSIGFSNIILKDLSWPSGNYQISLHSADQDVISTSIVKI